MKQSLLVKDDVRQKNHQLQVAVCVSACVCMQILESYRHLNVHLDQQMTILKH